MSNAFSFADFTLSWSISGLLTLIIGIGSVYLYRRAVKKYMRLRAGPAVEGTILGSGVFTPPEAVTTPPRLVFSVQGTPDPDCRSSVVSQTFHAGLLAFYRAATVYAAAGLVHAAIAGTLLFLVLNRNVAGAAF
jgi:hypothetical protein